VAGVAVLSLKSHPTTTRTHVADAIVTNATCDGAVQDAGVNTTTRLLYSRSEDGSRGPTLTATGLAAPQDNCPDESTQREGQGDRGRRQGARAGEMSDTIAPFGIAAGGHGIENSRR